MKIKIFLYTCNVLPFFYYYILLDSFLTLYKSEKHVSFIINFHN